MSIKTSNIDFRPRLAHEMNDTIMRNAVVMAQERIGANRQIMVKELGDWEAWRDRAEQIRNPCS